jgi:predicted Fe-Mo cluster-binding NifX family protein
MPGFIHGLGADVILAGGMGPRAVDMFHAYGIEVATGAVGNVRKVLEAYLRGEVRGIVPCAHDHEDSCGGHGQGATR